MREDEEHARAPLTASTTLNQRQTVLKDSSAEQVTPQKVTATQPQLATTVDLWQLAGLAGTVHSNLLPEMGRLRSLSMTDLIRQTHANLHALRFHEALSATEIRHIGAIFESPESEIAKQIQELHTHVASQPRNASVLAVVIDDIATASVGRAQQPGFSWTTLLKDLAGAVSGGLGGVGLGPTGIILGAVSGAVATSL